MSICATPEELERSKGLQRNVTMTTEYPLTPVGLEAQSRAAIKAWCDDPSVQLEYCHKTYMDWMALIVRNPGFSLNHYHYRIAKPKKWYRVGLCDDGEGILVFDESEEQRQERAIYFDRWLDERKYYD